MRYLDSRIALLIQNVSTLATFLVSYARFWKLRIPIVVCVDTDNFDIKSLEDGFGREGRSQRTFGRYR